jgi:hypothetical protein
MKSHTFTFATEQNRDRAYIDTVDALRKVGACVEENGV